MSGSICKATFLACVLAVSAPAGLSAGDIPESDEPIKLALNEWTGQNITTHIASHLLEEMGYNVQLVTAGYFPQMAALEDNGVSATLEIWMTNIADLYDTAMDSGKVEDLGPLGLEPRETWFYPTFVGELCPGLPNWEALKDCGQVFQTAETFPNGRLLDYPADWGTSNVERLKGLDLPFTSLPAGSEGALVAEIKAAYDKESPLLLMFWKPHWIFAKYDLKQVELPPYEEGCWDDPSVGINPDDVYDCDFKRGDVRKLAWVGFKEEWPAAHALLTALTLTNEQQIALIDQVDQKGRDVEDVAQEWLSQNEDTWQAWVSSATGN